MENVCSINNLVACLVQSGMNPDLANLLTALGGVVLVATVPLVTVIFLIWIERKVAARVQDRLGPNRVGPFGLLQSVADAVKMITKEDITPQGADKFIYNLAPIIAFASVVLIWAVIPFTPLHIGADLSIGILYFVAVASIGTIKIMIAGWSSNNKYALLGAFRTIAQLLSYEVPLVLSLLVPVMIGGTLGMQEIVRQQGGMWFFFMAPVAAIMFFIANLAETGRAPFDLLEAESEIIAGYNIEYSGFKWGMFMAGEFMHAFTACLLTVVVFFGGWWGPGVEQIPVLGFIYLGLKTAVIYLFALVLRSTVPRVRIDQLMTLNWKWLVPISVANVIVTAFLLQVIKALGLTPQSGDLIAALPQTIILLVGNVLLGVVVFGFIGRVGRAQRAADQAVQIHTDHDDHSPVPAVGD
ncbi:MAG: NADH-quinone oxidoreductase subunit NuoH [Chloroflexi bacterium]|nr:NADH-quinone oxidoreductase subunit NuoH [Chloroflexota bacterium]MCC6896717.1 NADH-quinone oxidoreductase subunit NuoH [Anaerolineae bacterium]